MRKISLKNLILFSLVVVSFTFITHSANAIVLKTNTGIPGFSSRAVEEVTINGNSIGTLIAGIYNYAVGIVGIVAAIVLMMGGIMWLSAGGSADKVATAKSLIGASLTGLILTMSSYMILKTVNPDMVIFKPLDIPTIARKDPGTTTGSSTDPTVGRFTLGCCLIHEYDSVGTGDDEFNSCTNISVETENDLDGARSKCDALLPTGGSVRFVDGSSCLNNSCGGPPPESPNECAGKSNGTSCLRTGFCFTEDGIPRCERSDGAPGDPCGPTLNGICSDKKFWNFFSECGGKSQIHGGRKCDGSSYCCPK